MHERYVTHVRAIASKSRLLRDNYFRISLYSHANVFCPPRTALNPKAENTPFSKSNKVFSRMWTSMRFRILPYPRIHLPSLPLISKHETGRQEERRKKQKERGERQRGKGEARREGRERERVGDKEVPQNYRMTDSLTNLKLTSPQKKISRYQQERYPCVNGVLYKIEINFLRN